MNKEIEKLRELAKSTDPKDLTKVLKDPNCTESVIDIICSNEGIDWDSNEGHELEKLLVFHPNLPNEQFEITYEYSDSEEVRNLVLENPNCSIELKIKIVKDPNCLSDVIDKIVMDENFPWGTQDAETIKDAIASNPNTSSAQLQNLYDNVANEHQKTLILKNPNCPEKLKMTSIKGETVIGYKINRLFNDPKYNYGINLNPDKHKIVKLHSEDKLIVIARNS